tara:strand:+ start:6184 stop:6423 length:240 start_codon:yes stop_codon:yes gene_type:complete
MRRVASLFAGRRLAAGILGRATRWLVWRIIGPSSCDAARHASTFACVSDAPLALLIGTQAKQVWEIRGDEPRFTPNSAL